jgi:hypothetical protein
VLLIVGDGDLGFLLYQSDEHSLIVGVHELIHGLGNTPNTS